MTFSKRSKEESKRIADYRVEQRRRAFIRDNNQCAFCYFLDGKTRPAREGHHVFGRAKGARTIKNMFESYFCITSVCLEHHPNPIHSDMPKEWKMEIYDVIKQANINPINKDFRHEKPVELLGTELQIMRRLHHFWAALFTKEQANNQLQGKISKNN